MANDKWRCRLSVTPKRVRLNDPVKLTVTLSYGNTELTDPELNAFFNFKYDSDVDQLNQQSGLIGYLNSTTFPQPLSPISMTSVPDGGCVIGVTATPKSPGSSAVIGSRTVLLPSLPLRGQDSINVITNLIETQSSVTLQRSFAAALDDVAMGPAIRNRTAAIGFERYQKFIDCIFCDEAKAQFFAQQGVIGRLPRQSCVDQGVEPKLNIYGPYAYSLLKIATQVFLTLESGVVIRDDRNGDRPKIFDIEKEQIRLNDFNLTVDDLNARLSRYLQTDQGSILPYLNRIVTNLISLDSNDIQEVLPYCHGVLQHRLTSPSLIELIWSYWHEEGMLVQTMNAIARRFQNQRGSPHDPLGELEFDPLRPLNNLIWGFIQDEQNRLTVPRRAYEYEHHYGLSLIGKGVPNLTPADSRSKFIEGFHNLLSGAARFFKEDSDTTVIADAFPLLNALKEVHLLLAEGAHNQFGDLTWTARAEMLTIQWMLSRPEMKEFLRGRYMVPYQEDWMGAVDSMKKLQGWTDTTITHFHELAVTGERILLSVRYGDWVDIENIEDQAKIWARSWKPEIQRYIHGYRTVTGVDLAADITDTRDAATRYLQPSVLLQQRLTQQISAMPLRPSNGPDLVAARVSSQAALPRPARPKLPAYRKEI